MKTRLIALIAFTAVVAAACSTGLSEQRALTGAAPAGPGGTSVEIPNREDRPQQPGRPALGENARPYVETLELSIEDIQAFWTTKMPKVFGQEFEPIPNDKIFAYSQNNPPPACGTGQQPSADDLVGNAFYCSEGGFIAFDDENLFPKLYKNFGSYAVAMVLAHEWGHAVQDQMGISGGNVPTVYLEQQADCFAGAWTKWVDDGDSPNLSLSPGSLDAALGGMLEFRDEPGTNPNDPAAHGSGFDRVRAFRDGFTKGLQACIDYETTPPEVLQLPFTQEEYSTGGNMEFSKLVDSLVPDFDAWMKAAFPSFKPLSKVEGFDPDTDKVTCGDTTLSAGDADGKVFYCASDNSIRFDGPWMAELNADSGDFATGLLLGMHYGVALQAQQGADDAKITSEESIEQRACLVGAYSGSLVADRVEPDPNSTRELSISGGDLDEALSALIQFTSADEKGASGSSLAFDRIEAFQNGVFEGVDACGF